jgi:hypothetical protein
VRQRETMDNPGHSPCISQAGSLLVRERLEIEALARELDRPFEEVAHIFTALESELRARARVTDYLPVLVARKHSDAVHADELSES